MIKNIIDEVGVSVIAGQLGESIQTISNWRKRGVPLESAVRFCSAVSYKITPHQLYPDQYPHPQDGLPESVRVAA